MSIFLVPKLRNLYRFYLSFLETEFGNRSRPEAAICVIFF